MPSELAMPTLESLSLNNRSPPATTYQQQPTYFQPQAAPAPRQPVPVAGTGPEAHIQSWAGTNVEQPKPVSPMQGMWTPDMSIKFGGSGVPQGGVQPQQGGNAPAGGKWEPGSGIRFG